MGRLRFHRFHGFGGKMERKEDHGAHRGVMITRAREKRCHIRYTVYVYLSISSLYLKKIEILVYNLNNASWTWGGSQTFTFICKDHLTGPFGSCSSLCKSEILIHNVLIHNVPMFNAKNTVKLFIAMICMTINCQVKCHDGE